MTTYETIIMIFAAIIAFIIGIILVMGVLSPLLTTKKDFGWILISITSILIIIYIFKGC